MFNLIGITGKARTGKDTVAQYLVRNHGYIRNALADPLKLAAQKMFMLSDAQTWEDEFKEVIIPFWDMSPREMFQKLGTEGGREVFGDDIWLKRWSYHYDAYKDHTNYVTSDVRFPNEAAHIRNLGGVIIHVTRNKAGKVLKGGTANHASEKNLPVRAGDFKIENTGSKLELEAQVAEIVNELEKRKHKNVN